MLIHGGGIMNRRFLIKEKGGEQTFTGIEVTTKGNSVVVESRDHPILSAYDFHGRYYTLKDEQTGKSISDCFIQEWIKAKHFLFKCQP